MLPKKLGSLMSNLATKGHGDEALDLARTLLELLPRTRGPRPAPPRTSGSSSRRSPMPASAIGTTSRS